MKSANVIKKPRKNKTVSVLRERFNLHVHHYLAVATPHGLVHLVRPKRTLFERIFWIICIILVAIPCVIISRQAWNRYNNSPTVNTLLRNYQQWRHSFPAVTICPSTPPNEDAGNKYWKNYIFPFFREHGYDIPEMRDDADNMQDENITTTPPSSESMALVEDIKQFVSLLFYGNYSTYEKLSEFKQLFDRINPEEYLTLNNLTSKVWETQPDHFERFTIDQTMTEFGICFTLNSILSNYSSPERFIKNDMSLISDPKISDIMPSEEDPFLHVNNIQLPIKLFVHSYNEIPSYLDNFFELNIESAMDMEVMTEKHTAVPDIRSLRISQRHCRFTDESDLKYFPVYSYNLCRLECKMRLAWRLCKCFPFYFRRLYGEKVCNLDGMICIGKHSHEFIHLHDDNGQGFCKGCDAKCEDEAITIVRSTTMPWMFSAEITIILKLLTQTRLQINTIYTETDFLVQIGGLAGLAYGIGLLSLVEIVYFLSLRCYFAIVRGKTIKTNL